MSIREDNQSGQPETASANTKPVPWPKKPWRAPFVITSTEATETQKPPNPIDQQHMYSSSGPS